MTVFISSDIEGTAGVVSRSQLHGESGYKEACILMTEEVNAAISGAIAEGAEKIVVCDAHWQMRNIDPEKLHTAATLIQGDPRPLGMMQGIDETFGAVFFTGYHAMAGTQEAVVDHTYISGTMIQNVRYNGTAVGECTINGLLSAYYHVPVVLVTGDDKAASQAELSFPGITSVVVKEGIGRLCGNSLHPRISRERIEKGAREAIRNLSDVQPPGLPDKFSVEVDFTYTTLADVCAIVPTVRRSGPRSVSFTCSDYLETYRTLLTLFRICESV
jgi:D-amino peptidase